MPARRISDCSSHQFRCFLKCRTRGDAATQPDRSETYALTPVSVRSNRTAYFICVLSASLRDTCSSGKDSYCLPIELVAYSYLIPIEAMSQQEKAEIRQGTLALMILKTLEN